MKVPKTLVFIAFSPLTFFGSLFVSWISFSALVTLSDDPFIYGVWPDIVEAASIQTAVSLIIEEIVSDFASELYWIAIPCALLISFWRVSCYVRGFSKEHQIWRQWYQRQQDIITQGNILEEPPVSESMRSTPYFREAQSVLWHSIQHLMFFVCHFSCWFSAFALLVTIMHPSNGIVETAHYLMRIFPDIAIPAVIHASLSSYQGIRGGIKGTGIARQMWMEWYDLWMKWYQRQQEAKALGYILDEVPPSPETVG